MSDETPAVEVEVVEVNDLGPVTRTSHEAAPEAETWRAPWQGNTHTFRIGGKWWPLWIIPAFLVTAFVLTTGLLLAILFAICGFIARCLRALFK